MAPRSVLRLLKMFPSHTSKSPGYHIQVACWGVDAGFCLFADSCMIFDLFVNLWTIVLPDVARSVGILQEFLTGCPVVLHRDIA